MAERVPLRYGIIGGAGHVDEVALVERVGEDVVFNCGKRDIVKTSVRNVSTYELMVVCEVRKNRKTYQ